MEDENAMNFKARLQLQRSNIICFKINEQDFGDQNRIERSIGLNHIILKEV
jgi:hypothetical protein